MSTIRLGLAGVAALAANVGGADVSFCPVTWAEGATLGGGVGEFRSRGPFGLQSSYCLRQHMQGAFYVSKLSFELIVSGGGWGGGLGWVCPG
jgi:hypothetical protein